MQEKSKPPIQVDTTDLPPPPFTILEVGALFDWKCAVSVRRNIAAGRFPAADLIVGGRPRWTRGLIARVRCGEWQPAPGSGVVSNNKGKP